MNGIGRTGSLNANALNRTGGAHAAGAPKKSGGFGHTLANFAKGVAKVGLGVAGAVGVPGANILGQALGSTLGGQVGNFGNTPGLNGGDMVQQMAQMNMQFLALQEATQMETRKFNTISNASKARHEAAMASIRNIK
jgi:hypothetical protein